MPYRAVDGTATTSDGDYLAKSGTLTFAPGQTTKTITIELKGDTKKEANGAFYLDLSLEQHLGVPVCAVVSSKDRRNHFRLNRRRFA